MKEKPENKLDSQERLGRKILNDRLSRGVLKKKPVWLITGAYMGHMWELFGVQGWIGPSFVVLLTLSGFGSRDALVLGSLAAATAIILGGIFDIAAGYISDRIGRCKTAIVIRATSTIFSFSVGWLTFGPFG